MKCVLNVFKLHNYLYLILFALLLLPTNRTSCSSSRVRAAFEPRLMHSAMCCRLCSMRVRSLVVWPASNRCAAAALLRRCWCCCWCWRRGWFAVRLCTAQSVVVYPSKGEKFPKYKNFCTVAVASYESVRNECEFSACPCRRHRRRRVACPIICRAFYGSEWDRERERVLPSFPSVSTAATATRTCNTHKHTHNY